VDRNSCQSAEKPLPEDGAAILGRHKPPSPINPPLAATFDKLRAPSEMEE